MHGLEKLINAALILKEKNFNFKFYIFGTSVITSYSIHYTKLYEDFENWVVACIEVTCRKREPLSKMESVILDADVAHVADENFIQISKRLKREITNCQNCNLKYKDYWEGTFVFLERLKFYSDYVITSYSIHYTKLYENK